MTGITLGGALRPFPKAGSRHAPDMMAPTSPSDGAAILSVVYHSVVYHCQTLFPHSPLTLSPPPPLPPPSSLTLPSLSPTLSLFLGKSRGPIQPRPWIGQPAGCQSHTRMPIHTATGCQSTGCQSHSVGHTASGEGRGAERSPRVSGAPPRVSSAPARPRPPPRAPPGLRIPHGGRCGGAAWGLERARPPAPPGAREGRAESGGCCSPGSLSRQPGTHPSSSPPLAFPSPAVGHPSSSHPPPPPPPPPAIPGGGAPPGGGGGDRPCRRPAVWEGLHGGPSSRAGGGHLGPSAPPLRGNWGGHVILL